MAVAAVSLGALVATAPAASAGWYHETTCTVRQVTVLSAEVRENVTQYQYITPPFSVVLEGNATYQYRIRCKGTKSKDVYLRKKDRYKTITRKVNKTVYRTRIAGVYAIGEGYTLDEARGAANAAILEDSPYGVYDVWYGG